MKVKIWINIQILLGHLEKKYQAKCRENQTRLPLMLV